MKNNTQINHPIAIIGIGCRFPGNASNPNALWELLKNGIDAIIDVPGDRWSIKRFYDPDTGKPGKMTTRQSGFLKENIYEFDPLFFGISPREAETLDPQQRLLLETTYEAIEDAGLPIESLQGSNTGVFIGGFTLDHYVSILGKENREMINSHTAVSSTMTMLSNRLSYSFDLKGPSVSMDTACSSSLVAAHYACQSIWNNECSMAIVGGVNIILRPDFLIAMSKGRFTSKHGRCKTFDQEASGYGRGEGAGAVILKPYPRAVKDNDPIYALIRATGVNQDGRTSSITVPNLESQKALLKQLYQYTNIDVNHIHYVEAHGTGTSVGDSVELEALNEVLSQGRKPGNKCLVGSIKTNIGHLEAGAGIAGIIKTALCLKNKQVPPNLHFNNPNPLLKKKTSYLKVPTKVENLPGNELSVASINSFGYGGTNAHAILQEAPVPKAKKEPAPDNFKTPFITPITAKDDEALKELSGKYHQFLTDNINLRDFIYTTSQRRSHHKNRLAVVAETKEQLTEKLESYSNGILLKGMVNNHAYIDEKPKLVFVYTGMGPQWWKMGRELMEAEPVFRQKLEECDRLFHQHAGWSILNQLLAEEKKSRMSETQIAQPANFFIQVALTELLKTYGIVPDAVVGHSVGEVAAACVSGALSLSDSLLVSYHRSRLQQKTAGSGTMLAISLTETGAKDLIQSYNNISIAAVNSPTSVTLAGKEDMLKQIAEELEAKEIFNRLLQVEVPYHSYLMEPIQEELLNSLKNINPKENQIPIYSTVTGERLRGTGWGKDYWWANVRQPVKFAKAMETILNDGHRIFLEIGPHPVLRNSIKECLAHSGTEGHLIQTLNKKEPEILNFFEGLAALFTLGFKLNWQQLCPTGETIRLPGYPWQKKRYWVQSAASQQDRFGLPGSVFFNTKAQTPEASLEVELNELIFPFIKEHVVQNSVVLPGATYAAVGLALDEYQSGKDTTTAITLQDIEFHQILLIDTSRVQMLHTTFDAQTNTYSVYSRFKEEEADWKLHATGRILQAPIDDTPYKIDLHEIKKRCTTGIPPTEVYKKLKAAKLEYGPYFRTIKQAWKGNRHNGEMICKIQAHQSLTENANKDEYLIHPTILDGSFQAMVVFGNSNTEMVPVFIGRINYFHSPGFHCWCYIRIKQINSNSIKGDIRLCDETGTVSVEIDNLVCREIVRRSDHTGETEADKIDKWFYDFKWHETGSIPLPNNSKAAAETTPHWLIFASESEYSDMLSTQLTRLAGTNMKAALITPGNQYKKIADNHYQIRRDSDEDMQRLLVDTSGPALHEIIYLWAMEIPGESTEDIPASAVVNQCLPIIYLTRALAKVKPDEAVKITMVTRGCQIVNPGDKGGTGLTAAPLWGLAHLLKNEFPHITTKMVDLEPKQDWQSHPSNQEIQVLVNELLSNNPDEDLALRENKRYVKCLEKISLVNTANNKKSEMASTSHTPVELALHSPGGIENLYYKEMERKKPAPNEVEIKVHASALNYKDLLKVVGKISPQITENTYFKDALGMEVSGEITRVGEAVTGYQVGDEVAALGASGNFKSYITVGTGPIIHKPKTLSHTEAVILVPYLTVLYGLGMVAHLQKDEKILIHNATGGVGLAAIQYARWKGAEIFATAGTPEKREYLKSIGIEHIMDSRTLKFVKTIEELTDGYGVDVVINAIAGEALYQSFSLLAPYGRFIELGKKDISENNYLPMKVFNRNITFAAIDIDRLLLEREPVIQGLLKDIAKGFQQGYFYAMPTGVFPAGKVVDAFYKIARAKHIGKIVLDLHNQQLEIEKETSADTVIKTHATYLITGGTRGFGLEIAKWLSEKSAGHVVLVSRSGASSGEARQAIAQMQQQGTTVSAYALDVSLEKPVKELIEHITRTMPPLTGIFHGAMVLDDGYLVDMDKNRFTKVIMPKVGGVLNLHKYTKDLPLDFFINFSSISSIIGNPGQANYIAANAFLDAFAHHRCTRGLPTTTINLGALKEVGVAARNENIQGILEGSGIKGLTPKDALKAMEWVIKQKPVQIGVFDVDWQKWAETNVKSKRSSRFQKIFQQELPGKKTGKETALVRQLLALEEKERQQLLEKLMKEELAKVLKLEPEKIDINRKINLLGIDSIMAAELGRALINTLKLEISPVIFLSGPTVRQVVTLIAKKITVMKN